MSQLGTPTLEPFPRFASAKLYLASSSDIGHLRRGAREMLDGLLNRLVTEQRIEAFEWESFTAESPMDQRLNRQENLPRPSDRQCVGLIVLFGEKIGQPLVEFDPAVIPGIDAWMDASLPHRLIKDWPEDLEQQRALVDAGGFPLTGTVFETLDALAAAKPVHVAYLADRRLEGDTEVSLNGWSWRNQMTCRLANAAAADWISLQYHIQTTSVLNFLNALRRTRHLSWHQTAQEVLRGIRDFVVETLGARRLSEDNPYRFLDFYDILDADDLPGRTDAVRSVVNELRRRTVDASAEPPIARITGESGCGKTSFMRAGVLAVLSRPGALGRFKVLAVRPTDFHDDEGVPDRRILVRLLEIVARELPDLPLALTASHTVEKAGAKAPQLALDALLAALPPKTDESPCIVIGLDQFEEIVDDLTAPSGRTSAANWRPLLTFVALAAQSGRFGFIYTLESSRLEAFSRVDIPRVFHAAYEMPLGGHDDLFIETVITRPFEKAKYSLDPRIVNQLLIRYKEYSAKSQGYASTLPLLALKLSNLFDTVQNMHGTRNAKPASTALVDQFDDSITVVTYDELKDELKFDNEIEELANAAWAQEEKNQTQHDDDINYFLQPLVTLSGDDYDRITLQSVGESRLLPSRERRAAFEDVRLIIREGGRQRLVHEAVVRQWSRAAKWLERQREYLVEEALFRATANYWVRKGSDPAQVPSTEEAINTAATILRHHMHEWSFSDPEHLSPSDAKLLTYCEVLLGRSASPSRTIGGGFNRSIAHIHLAAAYGLTDLVDRMITIDPGCLDLLTAGKRTPLDQASWGKLETARLLLERGANPVNVDEDGWPTISAAIWQRNAEMFRLLQPYYRTVDQIKCSMGTTLLHVAARRGEVGMAATLLNTVKGADPNQEDEWGRTPLDYTTVDDKADAFMFFLGYCDIRHRSSRNQFSVLHWAAQSGSANVVDAILSIPEFSDLIDAPEASGCTALMIAAQWRRDEIVRRLVDVADVNYQSAERNKGWTALHYAIAGPDPSKRETRISRQQALRTVRALLAAPDIKIQPKGDDGKEPISLAGSLPRVRNELLSHPTFAWSERLADGTTPLHFMIKTKDRAAVERMLKRPDIDLEALSANGDYILSRLIVVGMEDLALRLLQSGAVEPWKVEGAKDIGLAAAAIRGHAELVEAFLATMPATIQQGHRETIALAASVALVREQGSLFDRLLDHVDASHQVGKVKMTVMHAAAMIGAVEAWRHLIARGADLTVPDYWGRVPIDLAPESAVRQLEALVPPSAARSGRGATRRRSKRPAPPASQYLSFSDDAWTESAQLRDRVAAVGPIDGRLVVNDNVLVRERPLPMYDSVRLLCLTSPEWQPDLRICYLVLGGDLFRLSSTSPPIHEVNAKAPIKLTDDNVLYYFSFFCFFVRSDEGPFYVVHDLGDELLPPGFADARPPASVRTPRALFRRPRVHGRDGDRWRLSGLVHYSNALFTSDFLVSPTGMIEMLDDEPLLAELPVRMTAPLVSRATTH